MLDENVHKIKYKTNKFYMGTRPLILSLDYTTMKITQSLMLKTIRSSIHANSQKPEFGFVMHKYYI